MMKTRTWHSGPPPSPGWWPASYGRDPEIVRWWNGEVWSVAAHPTDDAKDVGWIANTVNRSTKDIEWCERWWL